MVDEATFILPLEGVIDIAAETVAPRQGGGGGREGARFASPLASPIRALSSAPSPRPWRRRGRTMPRRLRTLRNIAPRWPAGLNAGGCRTRDIAAKVQDVHRERVRDAPFCRRLRAARRRRGGGSPGARGGAARRPASTGPTSPMRWRALIMATSYPTRAGSSHSDVTVIGHQGRSESCRGQRRLSPYSDRPHPRSSRR